MEMPLLQTKLYIPSPRLGLVARPQLIDQLNQGLQCKLTLISAPAGFGKTTLVSEWMTSCQNPVAWLSLDIGDNNPTRFLAYLIAALQTIDADCGVEVLSLLQSPQPPPIESMLTALLNEIATIPDNFILVLDDYHLIDAQSINHIFTFLLDHLPPQLHLIIATREDPPLPLARYRARGQLIELRAADLRFTPTESSAFLNQLMGLNLSADEIAALETRTEGWVAGLQLAALALQGPLSRQGGQDTTSFIQSFTGSHHFVLDYLVEEVLQQQPKSVQTFLLCTSILGRFCSSLCDVVLNDPSVFGEEMLAYFEQTNLFIVPLDNERRWYRYHHLFAELLKSRLMKEQPHQVPTLHQRASVWYEQNDLSSDAIHHALAAKDFERAASLVELAGPALERNFQSATLLGWLKALPDELIRARPVLCVGYAWALTGNTDLGPGKKRLQEASHWLDTAADMVVEPIELSDEPMPKTNTAEIVVTDEAQFRSLPAKIAIVRAYLAQALGDISGAIQYAQQALDFIPDDNDAERAIPTSLLGMAYWHNGDLVAAQVCFAGFRANYQQAGNIASAISGTSLLADIQIAQGHLLEAMSTYEQALKLVTKQRTSIVPGLAELYVGLSELHCERGNMEAAAQHLLQYEALDKRAMISGNEYRLYPAIARIKAAQGDMNGALALLDEAEQVYYRTVVPDVRPIAAQKVRVWLKQGRLTEALGWVRERGLSVDDDVAASYLHEFEYITLVRIHIIQYRNDPVKHAIYEAAALLERLLKAAETGRRIGSVIEILVLQALTYEAQGDVSAALVSLKRALRLAEPEGYVRIFVEEGLPMARLLDEAVSRQISPDYTRYAVQLLAAFPSTQPTLASPSMPASQTATAHIPLIEPLSEREVEVLQLIATGLSNREIAERLYLSLNTVKAHSRNIYGKLDVHNRTQAVAKARGLGILSAF